MCVYSIVRSTVVGCTGVPPGQGSPFCPLCARGTLPLAARHVMAAALPLSSRARRDPQGECSAGEAAVLVAPHLRHVPAVQPGRPRLAREGAGRADVCDASAAAALPAARDVAVDEGAGRAAAGCAAQVGDLGAHLPCRSAATLHKSACECACARVIIISRFLIIPRLQLLIRLCRLPCTDGALPCVLLLPGRSYTGHADGSIRACACDTLLGLMKGNPHLRNPVLCAFASFAASLPDEAVQASPGPWRATGAAAWWRLWARPRRASGNPLTACHA